MSWVVDNAGALYVQCAIAAAGFVVAWRFNQRVKFLGYGAGFLAVMGLIWLTTRFFSSDRKQVEENVHAMAAAIVAGKTDELFKHISRDFHYRTMTRDMLHQKARAAVNVYQINQVKITDFNVDELSREKKFAKASFRVSAWAEGHEGPYVFVTRADFVLEDGEWKLKTMRFYNPFGGP